MTISASISLPFLPLISHQAPPLEQQEGVSRILETHETPSTCRPFSSWPHYSVNAYPCVDVLRVQPAILASQGLVSDALPSDARHGVEKSVCVIAETFVKSKRLFIKIAKHMIRLDAHIGSLDRALQKRPKIF